LRAGLFPQKRAGFPISHKRALKGKKGKKINGVPADAAIKKTSRTLLHPDGKIRL